MATDTDAISLARVLRASHERLAGLVAGLSGADLREQSYDTDWSVADVLSHLGSGAEIFALLIDAGTTGGDRPAPESFQPIWAAWNARSPEEQAAGAVRADAALVSKIEALTPEQRAAFSVQMFGPAPFDLVRLLSMRLSEQALHTWDIAVALDPAARVAPDAVDLLIDQVPVLAGLVGKQAPAPVAVAVATTAPERAFILDTAVVSLVPGGTGLSGGTATASLALPAEALVRLVAGRLDDAAELTASGVTLLELKSVFPGF